MASGPSSAFPTRRPWKMFTCPRNYDERRRGRSKTSCGLPTRARFAAIRDHASRELERLFLIVRDEEARRVNLVEAAKPAPG